MSMTQHPEVRYVYVQPAPFSSVAIVGFVFSLLWLLGIGSVVGVICGLVALNHTANGGLRGRALAHWATWLGVAGIILAAPFWNVLVSLI